MDERTQQTFTDCLARLVSLGRARDRATEREPRTITITDDDALAILAGLDALAPGGIWSPGCSHPEYAMGHCAEMSCSNYAGKFQ